MLRQVDGSMGRRLGAGSILLCTLLAKAKESCFGATKNVHLNETTTITTFGRYANCILIVNYVHLRKSFDVIELSTELKAKP